jgi:hypothetical protein
MNKTVMAAVFAAGLAVVAWVGWGFVGSSPLALLMTLLIAAAYLLGAYELLRFRQATATLSGALAQVPQPLTDLQGWLQGLHASLRHPVRQRIEGARVGLPGPALTPYLVGLLVMLGMLGTFLGMVVTFKGAVSALEASSNLEAIRAALAEPIKGLGLSFGTSVAGVASSAMLGLMSALCRRERLGALRALDVQASTTLRAFSGAHQRQAMIDAMLAQAQAMPQIAERLHGLAEGLEQRHAQLHTELRGQQQEFHREAAQAYTQLAGTVGDALTSSLGASARMAGDTIRPVVEQAMVALAQESERAHQRLNSSTATHMQALSAQWEGSARQVADTWSDALQRQSHTQGALVGQLDSALGTVTQAFEQRSQALLGALHEAVARSQAAQTAADQQRAEGWTQSLQGMAATLAAQWQQTGAQTVAEQRGVTQALSGAAQQLEQSLHTATQAFEQRSGALLASLQASVAQSHSAQLAADAQRAADWSHSMNGMSATLAAQWQQVGAQTVAEQQGVTQALAGAANQLDQSLQTATQAFEQRTGAMLAAVQGSIAQSHSTQLAADEQRLAGWTQAMDGMAAQLATQWQQLGAQTVAEQQGVTHALAGAASQLDLSLQTATQAFEQRTAAMLAAVQEAIAQSHRDQRAADQQRVADWTQSMDGMTGALNTQWRQVGAETLAQQQAVCQALEGAAAQITERMSEQVGQTLQGAAQLLEQSDALVRTRIATEAQWVQDQGQRMEALTSVWRGEMASLRGEEAQRGQAAVERLDGLQAAVAEHLATLGNALEAPLTRLLQTASDVPQAAAGVITQLRQEMTQLSERDNAALAERTVMMEQLGSLLQSVNEAAGQQRAAIESLVGSAAQVLEQAGQTFAHNLGAQASKANEVAAHVAASAVELSSLGESFGHGVGLFTDSNQRLLDQLQRIEGALGESLQRSDEQLAYYVAQAREVIDLSIASQQGIVEDLRRLNSRAAAASHGVAG